MWGGEGQDVLCLDLEQMGRLDWLLPRVSHYCVALHYWGRRRKVTDEKFMRKQVMHYSYDSGGDGGLAVKGGWG